MSSESMILQCECGKFSAKIESFPKSTPGRLVCYCDDCQTYLHHLGRSDLLDPNGGTEIIPAYPSDVRVMSGIEHVKCTRLSSKGMFRFSTSCCNTPIGNTAPNSPWIGFLRRIYTTKEGDKLDRTFSSVRSSIMGRYAKGIPPPGTPKTFDLKGMAVVVPFMLKGMLFGKFKPSPFFLAGSKTPIVTPHVLSDNEVKLARDSANV